MSPPQASVSSRQTPHGSVGVHPLNREVGSGVFSGSLLPLGLSLHT